MYGLASVSLASLALFSSSVQALPYNSALSKFFGHADPAWSQSAQSSQPTDPTTTVSTINLLRRDAASDNTNALEYVEGSGFTSDDDATESAVTTVTAAATTEYTLSTETVYTLSTTTAVNTPSTGYGTTLSSGTGYTLSTGTGHTRSTGTGHTHTTGTGFSTYTTAVSSASSTQSATSTSAPASSSTSSPLPNVLQGVNIGGWLVLEEWMNSTFFDGTDASDQWTFDSTDNAESKLQDHWSTYFTESDVAQIASWGLNAVRIPIGYWAYDNSNTPYITGADAYLEKAIGWCRTYGIKVLVDCHGSPGSQNGFDNSGHAGDVSWQSNDNMNKSITILETMAKKYGSTEYADVVFGIEMVNEPISWGANNFNTTKQWAQDAYNAIKSVATNADLNVIMHDSFMGPSEWQEVGDAINGDSTLAESKFWIDTHLYQNQVASDSELDQEQHIEKACNWTSTELLPSSSNLPVIVGEFSAATNICANPDGSTVAGSACYIDGCQCSSNVNIEDWNEPLIEATRKFVEAEMEVFDSAARGWFMWSYTGPGAWGYATSVQYGVIGDSVTDRKYPGQCSSS